MNIEVKYEINDVVLYFNASKDQIKIGVIKKVIIDNNNIEYDLNLFPMDFDSNDLRIDRHFEHLIRNDIVKEELIYKKIGTFDLSEVK